MKKLLLSIAAVLLLALFAAGIVFNMNYVPAILMYHNIDDNAHLSKLSVTPESFKRQMKFLKRHNYNVVSLDEMVELVSSGKRVPRNTVAITFDDGYENNFTNAFPVLKNLGLPATIFIPPDNVGKEGRVDWAQIIQMSSAGIDIGSHTKSDTWLPRLDGKRLWTELSDSKREIEAKTGKPVTFISYPLGGFNELVKNKVKEAGYKGACATNPGKNFSKHDIYALKRVRISRTSDNLFVFWIESSGYYTFIKEIRDEE